MKKRVVKYICPSCGGSAKRMFLNHYKCKYCGNEFKIEDDDNKPESTPKTPKEKKVTRIPVPTDKGIVKLIGVVAALFFVLYLIVIFSNCNSSNNTNKASIPNVNIRQDQPTKKVVEFYDLPQHERGKQYASLIFGKPFSEITTEDLAKVKYINIDSSFDSNTLEDILTIEYSFDNYEDYTDYAEFEKTIKKVQIYESNLEKDYDVMDFGCYKNLKYFDAGSGNQKVFSGLKQLSGISINDDNVKDLDQSIDPERVKSINLYVSRTFGDEFDYKQLAKFKNLERLIIDDRDLTKLPDVLKTFKNLKSLYIDNGEKITDFKVLKDLKGLNNLELHRVKNLKDLSIISNLPLTTLFLENSAVNNYNAFQNNTTMKRLTLHFNSNVTDITPVSTMSGLEEFDTIVYSIGGLDSLSNLKNLKQLTVSTNGSTSMQFIAGLDNLEELNLQNCYLPDGFGFLTALPKLKILNVINLVNSVYYKELDNISSLENLTITCSEHDSIYLEDLLASSHLKNVTLKGGYVGFNLSSNYADSSIENLMIKDIKPTDLEWKDIDSEELVNKIAEMGSVNKLGLINLKLSNIDSLSALTALTELDVSKNYIDHFDSIQNFPNLNVVKIADNIAGECPGYHGLIYNPGAHIIRQN